MSREIKFRVWDDVIHGWHASKAIDEFTDNYTKEYNFNIVGFGNPKRVFIEQYTGLKDKNGKEIYEGDIIQCHLSPISSTIFTGVVEFRPGCIMFKNFADGGAYAFNFLGAIEAVIGNIHENPELLDDSIHGPYGPIGEENIGGESRRMKND